ncbi:MAG: hypothetical protein AAGD07_12535 [Planctomycetota bacterium]
MNQNLLEPTALFRFEITLQRADLKWTRKGLELPERYRIPFFSVLAGGQGFADLRVAWSEQGIGFWLGIAGKRQMPWCRDTRMDESDGLHLWFDTRNSPNIHRATKFCHRFLFLPSGGGTRRDKPVAALVPINRARENPRAIPKDALLVHPAPRHDGYQLSGLIPAKTLTGYDPAEQSRIGFYCAVADRELGTQTVSLSETFPFAEDPSMWVEAQLG